MSGWHATGFFFAIGVILFGFGVVVFNTMSEDALYHDKCLVAGGFPIVEKHRYCIKPNSFIEVK